MRVTFDLRRQFLACCQVETTKLTVWIPFALTQHLVWAEVVALCHHVKPKYFEDLAGTLGDCYWLDLSGSPHHVSSHLSSESRLMESLRCVCPFG